MLARLEFEQTEAKFTIAHNFSGGRHASFRISRLGIDGLATGCVLWNGAISLGRQAKPSPALAPQARRRALLSTGPQEG